MKRATTELNTIHLTPRNNSDISNDGERNERDFAYANVRLLFKAHDPEMFLNRTLTNLNQCMRLGLSRLEIHELFCNREKRATTSSTTAQRTKGLRGHKAWNYKSWQHDRLQLFSSASRLFDRGILHRCRWYFGNLRPLTTRLKDMVALEVPNGTVLLA